jgi:putative PIN family toxin of toxin-antitoxin system
MTIATTRAVFDCNIFLQALASPDGPAGQCLQLAIAGNVQLFISQAIVDEICDVAARPKVIVKLKLVPERLAAFIEAIEISATLLSGFPDPFEYRRDPDDANYVNLALAANAALIVSRDKDLLDLMDTTIADGAEFKSRFPLLRILDPVTFLRESRD